MQLCQPRHRPLVEHERLACDAGLTLPGPPTLADATLPAAMARPWREDGSEEADAALLARARRDDRQALEALIARHQPWIFNIALRMLYEHADAEDATQEILIKVLKALPSFRGESKFSTWLYRIAVNHVLNDRKAKWAASEAVWSFADASAALKRVPDLDPPDPSTIPVPFEILVEEVKVSCVMGTLLCLDRRQRLVFILGTVFGVSDDVGAELVGVTPANFRQLLSRARRDLYEYLHGNCSLVEPGAACKCARKTRAYIQEGFVDPRNLRFTASRLRRIRDLVVDERADETWAAYVKVADDLFRNHPFCESSEQIERLRRVLKETAPPE